MAAASGRTRRMGRCIGRPLCVVCCRRAWGSVLRGVRCSGHAHAQWWRGGDIGRHSRARSKRVRSARDISSPMMGCWPDVGKMWGPNRPNGRNRPTPVEFRPISSTSANLLPKLANFGRMCAESQLPEQVFDNFGARHSSKTSILRSLHLLEPVDCRRWHLSPGEEGDGGGQHETPRCVSERSRLAATSTGRSRGSRTMAPPPSSRPARAALPYRHGFGIGFGMGERWGLVHPCGA